MNNSEMKCPECNSSTLLIVKTVVGKYKRCVECGYRSKLIKK